MRHYVAGIILLIISGTVSATDWKLVSSNDGFWIKTSNQNQHELLLAYQKDKPQFLLILKTAGPSPNKAIPIKIKIDKGPRENSELNLLEKRPEQSIFRIEVHENNQKTTISRMIAGLNLSIYFNSGINKNKSISFSLKGFTVAFNDLLIGNEIGSLDPAWLIKHRKDRELYCLMTTNISIQAMQYRIKGKKYADTLHLIPQTQYSLINDSLAEIISQVYNIPYKNLPYEPRAEKYLIFSRCMGQYWQQRGQ